MKPIDYAKAAGVAVLLLALNLLLTTAAIFAWAGLVEPGKAPEHYQALAPRIAAWSAPIGGTILVFTAAWVLAKRRPERHAVAFASAMWAFYATIDIATGLPMGEIAALLTPPFLIHMIASLGAAHAGAALGRRRPA